MHRLLSRFVGRASEGRRTEETPRRRNATAVGRPPAPRKRSLNEAAHKQRH